MNNTIKEVLKGLIAGRRQKVGIMTVIPLLSTTTNDRFKTPKKVNVSTVSYGTVKLNNSEDEEIIVPTNVGYLVKQAAQNHGLMKAAYINKFSTHVDSTAACIQSSQCGTIAPGQHDYIILPWALRETAFNTRKDVSFSKLWNDISALNSAFGMSAEGHLEYFLDNFAKQLDQFVAEFETVPEQVGAIILINGKVAGIERAPNYEYWKDIWRPLIRECYGSLALQVSLNKHMFINKNSDVDFSTPINYKKVKTLNNLKEQLLAAEIADDDKVQNYIKSFLQDVFKTNVEQTCNDITVNSVSNPQFVGQVVKEDLAVVYASLITKLQFVNNESWLTAEDFKF